MSDQLLLERRGRVAVFTINRPEKRNSLNPEILFALGDQLRELASADEVRAVVIRGMGTEAFSSGYDIGRIPGGGEAPPQREGNPLEHGLGAVTEFPYPVIAMIHGYALGAGCHLAAVCDMRLASESARLGMPPAKLGVVYPSDGYELFLRLVGLAAAKEMFITGRRIDARRALEMGLVNQVLPEDKLEEEALALADEIAEENAPLAVKASKLMLNRLSAGTLSEDDEREHRALMAQAFRSEDVREARAAFAEKRRPRFIGR